MLTCSPRAGLNAPQELDQQAVDFGRALLLNPVSSAGNQNLPPKIRHVGFERGVLLVAELQHGVPLPRDKNGALQELRAIEKWRQRPVAIHVAVVIQAAREPGALVFVFEKIQIVLSEPLGQVPRQGG